jgi:hypothetical protein
MENKKDWYIKLLAKLKKIEAGEMLLADYIEEVSEKIDKFSDSDIQQVKKSFKLYQLGLETGDCFTDMKNNFIFVGYRGTLVIAKCADTNEPFTFDAFETGFVNGKFNNR